MGLAIVVAVVVAGTAVDILLWRTSSGRHPKTGPLSEAIAPSTEFARAEDLPGTAPATCAAPTCVAPTVEPLPDRSQRAIGDETALGFVPARKGVSSSGDIQLNIGPRRDRPALSLASSAPSSPAAVKTKKEVRVKPTPDDGNDFGMDLRTTTARHPTTTIDERDPYSP
jgi:hypothetical protein